MTTTGEPLLSVIIPVFNAAATVRRTIDSLGCVGAAHRHLVQTIVVNDGSTDDSSAIIQDACRPFSAVQWVFIDQSNEGLSAARNAGLAVARARWILFLDADDELTYDPLPVLRLEPEATAVLFAVELWRRGHRFRRWKPPRIAPTDFLDRFTAGCPVFPTGVFARRESIQIPFQVRSRYLEDWEFWLNNPAVFRMVHVHRGPPIARIHIHGRNRSSHLARNGYFRQRIAESALRRYGPLLTRKQRNNLELQVEIGRLQSRVDGNWRALFRWPCSVVLYLKAAAYLLLGRHVGRLSGYVAAESDEALAVFEEPPADEFCNPTASSI